jgi:predicted nucleotidyltransferase
MTLQNFLLSVVRGLGSRGVPFCLAGGFAYSLYAEPRTTVDVDLVVFSGGNEAEFKDVLGELFPSVYENTAPMLYQLISIRRFLIIFHEGEFVIDFLRFNSGYQEYETEVYSRRRNIIMEGVELPVISKEDLIILKAASYRERDKLDTRVLVSGERENRPDMDYVKKWAERLEIPLPEGKG